MSEPQLEGETSSVPAGQADLVALEDPTRRSSRPWVGWACAVFAALMAGALAVWTNQTGRFTAVAVAGPLLLYATRELLGRHQAKRFMKTTTWTILGLLALALAIFLFGAFSEPITDCDFCPEVVAVPMGSFDMGSPEDELGRYRSEGPVHRVTIDYELDVGVHEVNVREFRRFVEDSGFRPDGPCWTLESTDWSQWRERRNRDWQNPGFAQSDTHPVTCVSWNDANAYVEWLSNTTDEKWRLLSEAEWEYAARAGTTTSRFWGDDASAQCDYANGADQSTDFLRRTSCQDRHAQTSPVGSFKGNAFGLYDVMGNVSEWTADCWNPSYHGAPTDGSPWLSERCDYRVIRSGSRYLTPAGLRSAHRDKHAPFIRNHSTGFRVARERVKEDVDED